MSETSVRGAVGGTFHATLVAVNREQRLEESHLGGSDAWQQKSAKGPRVCSVAQCGRINWREEHNGRRSPVLFELTVEPLLTVMPRRRSGT